MRRIPIILLALVLAALPVKARAAETEACPHSYETQVVAPTCTQGGYTLYTCTLCQDQYEADPVDALEHDYTYAQEITPPTCIQGGYTTHYCQCGDSMIDSETDPVPCQELQLQPQQDATCTAEGVKAHYLCPVCEKIYWDQDATQNAEKEELVIPKMDHNYGPWETVTEATPEAGGQQQRKCQNCEDSQERTTDPLEEALTKPVLTVAVDTDTGKPVLSWKKITGATGYRIYRQGEYLTTVTELKMTDTEAVPGEAYTYHVVAVNDTQCSPASGEKTATCQCAKVELTIGRDDTTGKPLLSWPAVEGATRYQIYRSTKSNTGFQTLQVTEQTDFLDSAADTGKKYYYKVKALCDTSAGNGEISAVVAHTCDCAQPVVTATSGTTKGIRLSWKKVSGAQKYQIYRADALDGTYTRIATVSSTTYTDTAAPKNKEAYYKVRAYGAGTVSLSAYSEPVSYENHTFKAWKTVVPNTWQQQGRQERVCSVCDAVESKTTPILKRSWTAPKLTMSNDKVSGKPVLKWTAVSGATKYQVYVYDSETGDRVFLTETIDCTYTYDAAVPGQTYLFTVLAQNSSKCSGFASAKSLICKAFAPKLAFDREDASGKPILSWKAVDGAVSYRIYRSTSKTTGFKLLTKTENVSFTAHDAAPGKLYYYKIQAVCENAAANSANSAVASHTCDCPQVKTPAVVSAEEKGLTITWEKVTGGKNYIVYRADQEGGIYTKIATVSGNSYTDTAAPKNQVSYYKVRAYGTGTISLGAYSQAAGAMNHTYSRWNILTPSTWQNEGYRERTCSHCAQVEGQVIPVLKKTLPQVQLTVKADVTSGKPVLTWKSVTRAAEYWIYLYDGDTATYTLLDYTKKCNYTHSQAEIGQKYSFAVVAINEKECSGYSSRKAVVCRCATPNLTVGNDADTGKPLLSWKAVKDAVKYEIYRSRTSTGNFKLYKTTEDTSLTLSGASLGSTYYYQIRAVHESESAANSAFGSAKKGVCKLPCPQVTGGSVGTKTNLLEWKEVKDAKEYDVYRATAEKGVYSKVATLTKTRYVDYVSKGKTYFYKVVAVGEDSQINSVRSAVISSANPSPEKLKIFISPSCQKDNFYYKCGTSEATQCRAMARFLVTALNRCGFDARANVTAKNMQALVKDSNNWGADLHVPLHSNAHDRNTTGTRIFYDYYKKEKSIGYKVGKEIMSFLGPLTPGGRDLMMPAQLYELGMSKAPCVYLEVDFHDNYEMAKWLIAHKKDVAEAICQGICKFYGVTYIAPENP